MSMITISEAKKILAENSISPPIEESDLSHCLGRVLAQDIYSPLDSPLFTNSAMDGFAVKWEEVKAVAQGQAVKLQIRGESQAGIPLAGEVLPGSAIKISTGAPIPPGTDTVVPVENAEVVADWVTILSARERFQHLRFQGEEFKKGDLLCPKGAVLNPANIALLALVGIPQVAVLGRPRVAIITTGSELITSPGQVRRESQIYDSNTVMLKVAVEQAGGRVTFCSSVKDNFAETVEILKQAKPQCDLLIVSGGVSVGQHDHTKEASERVGYRRIFWEIKQKPGKPLFFARDEDRLLFGLPGNPVSALMGFVFYIYPLIYRFDGRTLPKHTRKAIVKEPIENIQDRAQLLRVKLREEDSGTLAISLLPKQGSHILTSMTEADGFIVVNEKERIKANEAIEVYLFPWSKPWDT